MVPFEPKQKVAVGMDRVALLALKALIVAALFNFPTPGQLIISEFMASNTRTLTDEDGDTSDWIEIYSMAATNINLSGWALSDNPDNLRQWKFPPIEIEPGRSVVVFASNKNRTQPGSPLHTNFRLSANGSFLGISDPLGQVVFSFGAAYPTQVPDVSFGIPWEEQVLQLIETNSPVRWFIPSDGVLETSWQMAEFDAATWNISSGGIGYDHNPPLPALAWEANLAQSGPQIYYPFRETSGTTATNAGSYGATHNASLSFGPLLNQAGVRPPEGPGLGTNNTAVKFDGRDDFLNTGKSVLNNLAAFTLSGWIKPSTLNVQRAGLWGQHQAIEVGFVDARLLQVYTGAGGTVQAPYPFASNQWHLVTVTGDGTAVRIYLDGILAAESGLETGNYGASIYPLVLGGGGIFDPSGNSFSGFIDEFAFYTRALSEDEIFNQFQAAVAPERRYTEYSSADLAPAMKTVNSSAFLRQEFTAPPEEWSGLVLRVESDDGFVAFLNGVEVGRENAPVDLPWNAQATFNRQRSAGLNKREIDLTPSLGLLHHGPNLLAVHALNASADDSDFFFRAELAALKRTIQTNNWRYFTQPSPGRINGLGETNNGPMIVNASHSPPLPRDQDPIIVTARMLQTFNPPTELTLSYRIMFGAETSVVMLDDGQNGDGLAGDGTFGAIIPAILSNEGQMVRWYFRSKDTQGNTSRWPPYRETRNSPQYLGTVIENSKLTNALPVLHWFVQSPASADQVSGTRACVFWKGEFYDNIFVNLHGQSSSSFPKKSYNFDFNTGYHLAWADNELPVEDINLLTTYPDKAHVRNILAYETFRDAGHPYHFVVPVRVERNGAFFSDAHMVEDGDEDYLERVGLDRRGALYKMYNTLNSATSGVEKKSRKFENNTDLQKLITGLALGGTAKTAFLYDNVNIPAMVNYLAAMIITGNVDCCHKNYYIYRDSEGTGEWLFLPWDVDLSFGRNWTSSLTYFDDTMYPANPLYIGSGNALPGALFANNAFKQMYLRRLRTLMQEQMQPPGTPREDLRLERRIADLYQVISPDAALDFARWSTWGTKQTMTQACAILTNQYMPARRNYLFVTQKNVIPGPVTNEVKINFGLMEVNPASGVQAQEYFSLTNTSKEAIDLTGWKISGAVDFRFAPGTVLPTNSALYLSPDVNSFRRRSTAPKGGQGLFVQGNYKGQLSARGETLVLEDNAGRVVKYVVYESQPTLAQQFLRITEIMYAPPPPVSGVLREDLEYLVLKNIGTAPLSLMGVTLSNGITFTFSSETALAPAESIYLAKNPDAFQSEHGPGLRIAGPYQGQLANSGEDIELYDAGGEKVLDLRYSNSWYPLTESQGYSLVIRDERADYSTWTSKENWIISPVVGGTAGIKQAWNNFAALYFSPEELANTQISSATSDPDGDGLTNYEEFTAATNPRDSSSRFLIQSTETTPGKVIFNMVGVAGRSYSVYSADSIDSSTWKPEHTVPRVLQTGPLQIELTLSPVETRFYRIKLDM